MMKKGIQILLTALLLLAICCSLCACGAPDTKSIKRTFPEVFSDYENTSANGSAPESVDHYLILLQTDSGDLKVINHRAADKLKDTDVVVLAVSKIKKADYGRKGSKVKSKTIESETVDIYYYNVEEQAFFAHETIGGHDLPDEVNTDQKDYDVTTQHIFAEVEKHFPLKLGVFGRFFLWGYKCFGEKGPSILLIAMIVIVIAVFVGLYYKTKGFPHQKK